MNITLHNIGKRFNSQWLYHSLNYEFEAGKAYAILGKNGSGKSTLMQMLYGYLMPTTGKVSYKLNQTEVIPEEALSQITFASPYMMPVLDYNLNELLDFHFSLREANDNMTNRDLANALEISDRDAAKPVKYFSSGMQQRIKTGLCLLTKSQVKMLDEPLTNMDKTGELWYRNLITRLPKDTLVIVASNDEAEYTFCQDTLQLS